MSANSFLPRLIALAVALAIILPGCSTTEERGGTYEGGSHSGTTNGGAGGDMGTGGVVTGDGSTGGSHSGGSHSGGSHSGGSTGGGMDSGSSMPPMNFASSGNSGSGELYYPTGSRQGSAILITKRAPAEVIAGQDYDISITVENLTDNTLQDVVLTEQPTSSGFSFISASPSGSPSGNGWTWALGNMSPRSVETITVRASANGDSVTSCTEVEYNSQLCLTTNVVSPSLNIVKRIVRDGRDISKTLACEPVTVEYTVTNTGTGAARNVTVTDSLPSCYSPSNVNEMVGTLGSGESRTVTMMVNVENCSMGNSGSSAATATADGGLSAMSNEPSLTVCRPMLEIEKVADRTSQLAERPVVYTITVRNTGDGPARDTMIMDRLGRNAMFKSASDGGMNNNGTVTWNLGELAAGAERSVSMTVRPNALGRISNMATAEAFCANAATSNTVDTEINGIPSILLEVVDPDAQDPQEVGGNVTYTIRITNQGSAPDTNVIVGIMIQPEGEYVSSRGQTMAENGGGQSFSFSPLPVLEVGAVVEWTVTVRALTEGDTRFKVVVNSDETTSPIEETEATRFY